MVAQLPGQARMDSGITGVTIKAGDREEIHLSEEQFARAAKTIIGDGDTPPSWEDLSEAFARVERVKVRIKVTKDHIKELMEDLGLVDAQDEMKQLKDDLKEAEGVRDELWRKMRASRVNTFTGEVR